MFSVLFGIRRLEAGSVTSQIVWKANPVEGESLQCSNTAAHSWTCEMKILFAYLYILGSLIRGGGVDAILGLSMWQLYAFVFFKTHVRHKIFKMNMITAFLHGPPVTAGPPAKLPLLCPALCSGGKKLNTLTDMLYFNKNAQVLVSYHNMSILCNFIHVLCYISDGNIIFSASLRLFHSCIFVDI